MSVLTAAEKVLVTAGNPLHYDEIAKRMLKDGLWQTSGKTPSATVNARLATDMKKRGRASAFQRTDKGVFALRTWGLPEYATDGKSKGSARKPKPKSAKHLSFTNAAEHVLDKYGKKRPLHYREITAKALELGLVKTAGKTPEATLYAQVLTEIKRRHKQGEQPRFVMHGKGFIGLSKWMGKGLAFQIEQQNQQVRKKLRKNISAMKPAEFEELIGVLLASIGFEDVEVTALHKDGGIDVRGTMVTGDVVRTRMAVQAKKWKGNVQAPIVQQVRGSLGSHEQGLIITISDFSKGARDEAERPDATPVGLMNGDQLIRLLIENDILVRRTSHDLIELAEDEELDD